MDEENTPIIRVLFSGKCRQVKVRSLGSIPDKDSRPEGEGVFVRPRGMER